MHEEIKQMIGSGITIYFPTQDTVKASGKTYYNLQNGEYVEFTGETFAVGVTYYERITIPVAHLKYTGSATTYVVWTITGEKPALCADDADYFSITTVDVDVFATGNYLRIVNAIKEIFTNNNWVWDEDSVEMYEEDTKLYHKTISFEKERYI